MPLPPPGVIAEVAVPGKPYRAAVTGDGGHVLVSLVNADGHPPGALTVISTDDAHRTMATLPFAGAAGITLTRDGRRALVAQKAGSVAVADVDALIAGGVTLSGWARTSLDGGTGIVALTHDERFAVTSEESAHCLAILDMTRIDGNVDRDAVVGIVPIGLAPIAVVAAPDRRHMLATIQASTDRGPGGVAVVTTEAFNENSGWGQPLPDAVVARVELGNAVRLALSPDGATVWVTLRAENKLIALDTADLVRGVRTVVASVKLGPAPVGVAFHGARYLLVANSNRFDNPAHLPQTVSVIDADAALAGRPAVVATRTVGAFPRELVPGPRGMSYLTNFNSNTITVFL